MAESSLLIGSRAICAECRIGYPTMLDWIRNGAPIRVETGSTGKKYYRTEKSCLLAWIAKSAPAAPAGARKGR